MDRQESIVVSMLFTDEEVIGEFYFSQNWDRLILTNKPRRNIRHQDGDRAKVRELGDRAKHPDADKQPSPRGES